MNCPDSEHPKGASLYGMRAAVYTRISDDRAGESAGVGRQREDCLAMLQSRGWELAGEYRDNDISAYSGKPRPGFTAMLADIRQGKIDMVVAYHVDRLYRRLRDLVPLLDACESRGCGVATTLAGDLDLGTASGRTIASILGAVAEGESARQAERIKREKAQRAKEGRPNGDMRSFGYNADGTINATEAVVVKDMVGKVLAGDTLGSIVRGLIKADVPTVRGGTWRITSIRQLLMSAKLSGQREWLPRSHGATKRGLAPIVADGQWDPIISKFETARLRRLLSDPARRTSRPGKRMLTGVLVCGRCGTVMTSHTTSRGGRRYECRELPGLERCGRVSVLAEPAEGFVSDVVIAALYEGLEPGYAKAPDPHTDVEAEALVERVRAKLKKLAGMYAEDVLTEPEWLEQRSILEQRLDAARSSAAGHPAVDALSNLPPSPELMRAGWPDRTEGNRRAIVLAVLQSVSVAPADKHGPRRFSPDRFTFNWREESPEG